MEAKSKYSACDHVNKKQPKAPITKELKDSIAKNYRVLPIYETAIVDHAFSRTHSLQRNEFLHCRWLEYQIIHISIKPDPFVFPHARDFHFFNYNTCYKPELSISARPTNRYSLRYGPGVDDIGEIPIPSDTGSRKTDTIVEKKRKYIKPILKRKKVIRK